MWSDAKKRRLTEGLCRPEVLAKPYVGHPFGRVKNREELHQFFMSGEAEPGKKFQRGHRATENEVSRMLREDFAPLSEEIPDHVKTTSGVLNSGSQLVSWIYETYDLYPEENQRVQQAEESQEQSKPEDPADDDHEDAASGEGEQQSNEDDRFKLAVPDEEYDRQVEAYYNWFAYKEELPDKHFPWEDEEAAERR
ncbi:hypothetical protein PG987_007351 [Apiospora arundinis]